VATSRRTETGFKDGRSDSGVRRRSWRKQVGAKRRYTSAQTQSGADVMEVHALRHELAPEFLEDRLDAVRIFDCDDQREKHTLGGRLRLGAHEASSIADDPM
jgi:hypothetical protein